MEFSSIFMRLPKMMKSFVTSLNAVKKQRSFALQLVLVFFFSWKSLVSVKTFNALAQVSLQPLLPSIFQIFSRTSPDWPVEPKVLILREKYFTKANAAWWHCYKCYILHKLYFLSVCALLFFRMRMFVYADDNVNMRHILSFMPSHLLFVRFIVSAMN